MSRYFLSDIKNSKPVKTKGFTTFITEKKQLTYSLLTYIAHAYIPISVLSYTKYLFKTS